MKQSTGKARPFVPTEIHVSTFADGDDTLGILSVQTTAGLLENALDKQAAESIGAAVNEIRSKLGPYLCSSPLATRSAIANAPPERSL
ncbi:hypothetical protein FJW04_19685 [Mesorhizobium sp. B2-7-3]|nr:hypothetical protein FJW04_19685 [Mesorhizobium sp. B2-7-3]TPL99611.1 hypothetical protein FJ943_14290 [Mesorhizobium sp. B2-3-10]